MNDINKALEIATTAHKGQVDKGGHPYINHPLEVANKFLNEKQKIVALLHDVVEDTNVTLDELSNYFTSDIIEAIRLLTKTEGYDVKEYYENIKRNPLARVVKLADLNHNSDISRIPYPSEADYQRIEKYKKYIKFLSDDSIKEFHR